MQQAAAKNEEAEKEATKRAAEEAARTPKKELEELRAASS